MVNEDDIAGGWCPSEDGKKCPVCGFEYIHLSSVGTLLGTDSTDGIKGAEPCGFTKDREAKLVLHFYCEDGHAWAETYEPCKGNLLHTWRREKDHLPDDEWDEGQPP